MKGALPPRFDPGGRITITLRSARLIDRTLWTKKPVKPSIRRSWREAHGPRFHDLAGRRSTPFEKGLPHETLLRGGILLPFVASFSVVPVCLVFFFLFYPQPSSLLLLVLLLLVLTT